MSIISDVIDLAARAKKQADELAGIELKETIAELRGKLLDLKEEILALREENTDLKAEKAKLALPAEVVKKDGLCYKADGNGPYCTHCYETRGDLISVVEFPKNVQRLAGKWRCPSCTTKYA
ncbi:MAG: hypothetical protein K8T89_10495 [Planctomycetes bacterium]|nr:hypothetical protein [Planctomycetota bacterium]